MGIIHVPEGRGLFSTLTVRENLEMGGYSQRARKHLRESLAQVLDTFPVMKDRQGQLAGSLSGGEQQMCSIARGLMARPRLLMIDEMSLVLVGTIKSMSGIDALTLLFFVSKAFSNAYTKS